MHIEARYGQWCEMMLDRTPRVIWLWTLAAVITLGSVVFQRLTGPSYPVQVALRLEDGGTLRCKFPTSHESTSDALILVPARRTFNSGKIKWRRLNSYDDWQNLPMTSVNDTLRAAIPVQPPAGKVVYTAELRYSSGEILPLTPEPIVIRFRGAVPPAILIPHILFMFFSMLLATRTGLQAAMNLANTRKLAFWTTVLLVTGGMILGPIVQKYAFGAFWTGWPFGHDLTDNKTAAAALLWAIAIWRGSSGSTSRWWYIAAAVVHVTIYLIPHSVLGSELDYTSHNFSLTRHWLMY